MHLESRAGYARMSRQRKTVLIVVCDVDIVHVQPIVRKAGRRALDIDGRLTKMLVIARLNKPAFLGRMFVSFG